MVNKGLYDKQGLSCWIDKVFCNKGIRAESTFIEYMVK